VRRHGKKKEGSEYEGGEPGRRAHLGEMDPEVPTWARADVKRVYVGWRPGSAGGMGGGRGAGAILRPLLGSPLKTDFLFRAVALLKIPQRLALPTREKVLWLRIGTAPKELRV